MLLADLSDTLYNRSQNLFYWRVCMSALNKSKFPIPPLLNQFDVLLSNADKENTFLLNFLPILLPTH